jgi:hypothetical protein
VQGHWRPPVKVSRRRAGTGSPAPLRASPHEW